MSTIRFRLVGTYFGSSFCPVEVKMQDANPRIVDVMNNIVQGATSYKNVKSVVFMDSPNAPDILDNAVVTYLAAPKPGRKPGSYQVSTTAFSSLPLNVVQVLQYYIYTSDGKLKKLEKMRNPYVNQTVSDGDYIVWRAISICMYPMNKANLFTAKVAGGGEQILPVELAKVNLSVVGIFFGTKDDKDLGEPVLVPKNTNRVCDLLAFAADQYAEKGFFFNLVPTGKGPEVPQLVSTIGVSHSLSPKKDGHPGIYSLTQSLNTAPQYVWQYFVYNPEGVRMKFGRIPANKALPFNLDDGYRVIFRLITINEVPNVLSKKTRYFIKEMENHRKQEKIGI